MLFPLLNVPIFRLQLLGSHSFSLILRTNGIETITFPNISTGIYGYPKIPAAKIT
ncbi:macro domain-containing protein [Gottfriedia acidiceleris]|uniref:macro domain-containing protein n=1 Tax=Gottfriedia acidiceleris TaxID=371036 RepID=UPI003D245D9B